MTLRKGIRMMRMRMTRMRGRSSQVSRLTAALTSACELGLALCCCSCAAAAVRRPPVLAEAGVL